MIPTGLEPAVFFKTEKMLPFLLLFYTPVLSFITINIFH